MHFPFIPLVFHACMFLASSSRSTAETKTTTDATSTVHPILKGKHESLSLCPLVVLEPGEFELFSNGTIRVAAYNNLMVDERYYTLSQGVVSVCAPFSDKDSEEDSEQSHLKYSSYLTLVGIGISMVSLLVHLAVFSVVPDLRNMPGWNLAALCASLLLGYLLLCVIGVTEVARYPAACVATASLTHFFLLSSMLWMSIMSYDVYMSLMRATGSFRISSTHFTWRRYGLYCLCSFGTALLFTVSSLLADTFDGVPSGYRPDYRDSCWFKQKLSLLVFFAGPVLALVCLNFIFFGLSAYTLHFNKMKDAQEDTQKSVLRRRYMMYFRLSVIMGVTWTSGIVASIVHVEWVWYVFVVLNTLQGFFIFLAFTCSTKVKVYFREKLFRSRRGSEQTLAPTFQSYCFYANSIEKDMDKIVEASKEKTDTIVIHL